MYEILVTERAQLDLESFISYIETQLKNPTAASRFYTEVEKCYGLLRKNPYIFAKCQSFNLEKEGYHKVMVKNYLILYKIHEDSKTVRIMRFFYGAQDYEKLI